MKGHCKGVQQLPHWVYPVGVQEVMSFLMICYPAEHMCSQRVGWVVLSCILLSPKVTCWCSRCNKECCVFMNLFIPLYHVYIWYIYNHLNCEPSHVKEPIFPKSKKNLSEVLLKTPWPHLSHWCSGTALPYYQRPAHLSTEGRPWCISAGIEKQHIIQSHWVVLLRVCQLGHRIKTIFLFLLSSSSPSSGTLTHAHSPVWCWP